MKVTRDVLMDLLPVYLSAEASPDTQALIEEHMAEDADFARLVEEHKRDMAGQQAMLKSGVARLAPDHEMATLERTKQMMHRRQWFLAWALLFSGFPFSFVYENGHFKFLLLRDAPELLLPLWGAALAFWILYFVTRRVIKAAGL